MTRAPIATRIAVAITAAALLCVVALAFGPKLWAFFTDGETIRAWVHAEDPFAPLAMGALVVAQIVVAVLPGEPVELAAGYLFGAWEGTLVCLAGGLVGTLIVTALVRTLGLRVVHAFFSTEQLESVAWLQDSARFELIMLVVFLIPGTPKDFLTYFAGLTRLRFPVVLAIATFGRLPSIVTSTVAAAAFGAGDYGAAIVAVLVAGALIVAGGFAYRALERHARR